MSFAAGVLAPKSFHHHLVSREKAKQSRKRVLLTSLSLTSMVDMFSLLVIFLLQTFSTSPELLVVSKGVTLPSSATGAELKDAPILSVAANGVYLDQKLVGKTEDLLRDPAPLMEKLGILRDSWLKSHPDQKFSGEINLQAHRDLPSTWISRIMGFLPSQHYSSIQLVVMGGK